MKKMLLASMFLFGACATTQTASAPNRATKEDALASATLSKDDGVRQCVMMEKARDPGFKSAHARVHVAASGSVESVAVMGGGHYELGDCIERALKSKAVGVAPNGPSDDYDVEL